VDREDWMEYSRLETVSPLWKVPNLESMSDWKFEIAVLMEPSSVVIVDVAALIELSM